MTDLAIDIIKNAKEAQVTFKWLRASFKADHDLKDSLNFGHAVIDTPIGLAQYLYTYGPMIESQWDQVAPYLSEINKPTYLIDYGCGQGLAGVLVNDLTNGRLLESVRNVLLIEPSALALARSNAIYKRIASAATIMNVCKRFDEMQKIDIPKVHSTQTLHLFSNSLDILGFDPLDLLIKTLRPGSHTIFSVSHDRGFNGGTPRIEAVKAAVEHQSMASPLLFIGQRWSDLRATTPRNPKAWSGSAS